jgi:hypothetical protein
MDFNSLVQPIIELVSGVGFPAAVVLILLFLNYKQGKKFEARYTEICKTTTEAVVKVTEAVQSLNSTVMILSERMKHT